MPQKETWITYGNGGIAVFEEDEEFKEHSRSDYCLSISAQGKTVEYPISEELFEEISNDFNNISRHG